MWDYLNIYSCLQYYGHKHRVWWDLPYFHQDPKGMLDLMAKFFTMSHRMFGHIHGVLNISKNKN